MPTIMIAQTYCYQLCYYVKDGVKRAGTVPQGTKFYFTFTNNKSKCYFTDSNGVYRMGYGQGTYQYVGSSNGILTYRECNQNMFSGGKQDMLYFSSDYSRLNWLCNMDGQLDFNRSEAGYIRVLEYVSNPDGASTPGTLY